MKVLGMSPVLVLDNTNDVAVLTVEQFNNANLPADLNGESGFHVFHVRMLTELILRQLQKNETPYSLTEEEIVDISIASSLHDIGKLRVPKNILDFPGKLSPMQYDIVKKHAALGEDVIADAVCDGIKPAVLEHAKAIARGHHERIDGMGYPDGLKGDAIPISAQVVALADVFDALTSVRNYKKAISQDVAIEMIANGMSGTFNPLLVDCLLQVINNKVLVDLRERYEKSRSVVMGQNVFVPKQVLLIGNTGYVNERFVEEAFPESRIMLVGESHLKTGGRLRVFNVNNPAYDKIFDTYDFDAVIYFARELSFRTEKKSDAEELKTVLECIRKTQKEAKVLYLSSLDSAYAGKTGSGLLALSKENLCDYYRNEFALDIRVVRMPYLYSGAYPDDFLFKLFKAAEDEKVLIDEKESSRCYFLSMYDVTELIARFFDNWQTGVGVLTINDDFGLTFGEMAEKLKTFYPETTIEFTGAYDAGVVKTNNKAVRTEYGWFSKISVVEDMAEEFERYLITRQVLAVTLIDKIKQWTQKHPLLYRLLELFGLFAVTEVIVWLTHSATFFSIVDFRMAYIVMIATIHGLKYGIAAAGLSSVSWLVAKMISGTNPLTIFYEPSNWFAFIYFFFVGALCGYIRLNREDKIRSLDEQNDLLEEKLGFIRKLYGDTYEEKRALKKQIIGSKDSFGKIFDVTRQLDTVEPRKLNLKIMDTFEDILENKTLSVYSVTENSYFGRLEVASRDIISHVSRSISLETYAPIVERLKEKEVWRNSELIPGLPMYAAGVFRAGKMELMIFIWHTSHEQQSLYYVNLFKILCDLVQISLLRAFDYNQAIYEKQYIKGTRILNTEAFSAVYENFKQMAERKVFTYMQIEIDCKNYSLDEVNEMLLKRVRANDILGLAESGKLRLLLSQATEKDMEFILPRFDGLGLGITVLNK